MVVFPNGKINLGLRIIGRRPDGFHDIDTVFCPVGLHDALEIIPAPDGVFEFRSTGLPIKSDPGNNLCTRAYELLKEACGLPAVKIHLHKVIPMGAGLGGGSSDGAFTLKLINDLFDLGLSPVQLISYARQLGSDCAFFIENRPCHAVERGDVLEPVALDLGDMTLVLVVPRVHVSTPAAYAAVTPSGPVPSTAETVGLPLEQWKDRLVNDFEKPVIEQHPEIGNIIASLYGTGAGYAAMSGSGSAVFGLFHTPVSLQGLFPGCFTRVISAQF